MRSGWPTNYADDGDPAYQDTEDRLKIGIEDDDDGDDGGEQNARRLLIAMIACLHFCFLLLLPGTAAAMTKFVYYDEYETWLNS